MNKIDKKLQEITIKKKIGIMTHVVIGYPSLKATVELIRLMDQNGVDMVELQIPFSDPLADGPTIMKACESALKSGTKVKDAFTVVKNLGRRVKIPLLFMCYYNTIFQYGVEKFCKDASIAGVGGLIVPDIPLDEEKNERFYFFARKYQLHAIKVISPASTNERLQKIAQSAKGFVYCTARQGITGAKKELDKNLDTYLQKVKQYISIPLAVGFGISQKAHVQALVDKADIAVVGSRVIDIINNSHDYKKEIGNFVSELNVLK